MPESYVFTIRAKFPNGQIGMGASPSPFTPSPKLVAVGTGSSSGSGLSDGDMGDVVVSGGGAVLSIDSAVLSVFGRTIINKTTASAVRTVLELGTAATSNSTAFEAAGAVSAGIASHVADGDPHPQYLTESNVTTALAAKADLVGGVIPTSQIPALAVTEFLGSVASQAAMLALTGQRGDWCIRTDVNRSYVLIADVASVLANWQYIETPGSPVTSVNGQTGVIVLAATDVGAAPLSHVGAGGSAHAAVEPGGPHGFMTGVDKTKLDGIEAGATATTTETIQDVVGAMVAAAGGSYDDAAGTISLPSGSGGTALHQFGWAPAVGTYISAWLNASNLTTQTTAAGRLDLIPFQPDRNITVDGLAVEVTTGSAGTNAKVAIYASDAAGAPTTLIVGSADLDCATTGLKVLSVTSTALTAGTLYWIGVHSSGAQVLRAIPSASLQPLGVPATIGGSVYTIRRATATYASGLPSTAPSTTLSIGNASAPLMRVA